MKYQSHEISSLNSCITLKFDRHIEPLKWYQLTFVIKSDGYTCFNIEYVFFFSKSHFESIATTNSWLLTQAHVFLPLCATNHQMSYSWIRLINWLNYKVTSLQWCHNDRDGVSNHQPHDCLPKRLFKRRSKKTSKLRVTGPCEGNSPVTGEFPAQMANNAEIVSIWWCHHGLFEKKKKV